MIRDRQKIILQKQQSLIKRVDKQTKTLTRNAKREGIDQNERDEFVQAKLAEYKKIEVVRMAVKEVRRRGAALEKKRKLKEKAYEGVSSKILGNMKVIDKVKKDLGFTMNPYSAKKIEMPKPSASASPKKKRKPRKKSVDKREKAKRP